MDGGQERRAGYMTIAEEQSRHSVAARQELYRGYIASEGPRSLKDGSSVSTEGGTRENPGGGVGGGGCVCGGTPKGSMEEGLGE